jgi:hypothetical protein
MNPATDWIDQARGLLDLLKQGTAAPAEGGGDGRAHGSDCRWCPVCQAASVVRGERPEVTAALADVLTTAATALRTFAAAGGDAPGGTAEPDEAGEGDAPAVQQIDIA